MVLSAATPVRRRVIGRARQRADCGTLVAAAASSLSTTTLSPSVTMRSASTVNEAVEAACAGDSHGAQTPVSAISRGRDCRRRHPGPWTAAVLRSALTALLTFSHGFVRYTRSTSLLRYVMLCSLFMSLLPARETPSLHSSRKMCNAAE